MVKPFTFRIEKLKNLLNIREIHNFLATRDHNIFYLTGFYGKDAGSLLLVTDNHLYLLVNSIYLEYSRKSVKNKGINIICCHKDKYEELGDILKNYDSKFVGFEGGGISFSNFYKLKKVLSGQEKSLINVEGMIEGLRAIKDTGEISVIKNACRITDKTFNSLVSEGKSAINELSEMELALKIEELLVSNGSNGKSFDIIVAYGKNSSMPHYYPQNSKSKDGLILMDFGCRLGNYCSDMTRTIFTDNHKKIDKFKEIYNIVLEAQNMALKDCREEMPCRELDRKVRKFIYSKGYGENFGHGLGHGVGLEIHEEPKINAESKMVLKENMVITIEPGIYIEDLGGVRIEDMVLVGKDKCELLFDSTKEFIILD